MDTHATVIEGEIAVDQPLDSRLLTLEQYKRSAFNWQQRRHADWTDNYTLYRDQVVVNQLTQRQSVNVPLMKTAVKTALKDIDDAPLLYFQELDNNKDREIIYNEYWNYSSEINKLVIKDIIDKKQVLLYGRSFKKLNIVDGRFHFEILDPQDVLVDRYVDPADIDSARYICHQHIFVPLSSLEANENYDKGAVKRLKMYMGTISGLIQADQNLETLRDRNERMSEMGVPDIDNPQLGETYIELNEHYLKRYDPQLGEDVFYLTVTGQGREVLLEASLEDVIGVTKNHYWRKHVPMTSWGDDIERTDIWSDGMADTLRTLNKILNSRISQVIENGTLRNYGMNFYDASIEGFTPQTYDPYPGAWYPLPGKPQDVYQRIEVPEIAESLNEIQFIMQLAEKSSATTSIQQGVPENQQITLGEVQILQANATARVKASSIFYNADWKEFGEKYVNMLEAASDLLDGLTLYKKGLFNDTLYPRDVAPEDWKSKVGYRCKVVSKDEKDKESMNSLQRLNAAKAAMPDNMALDEIYNKKLLEFADLSPDEMKQVLDFEKQKQQMMMNMPRQIGAIQPSQPAPAPQPAQPMQLPAPMM